MKHRFYESKILYILISALICIQFGAYIVQVVNNRTIAKDTLSEELMVGTQVFYHLLESRNQQLQQTADLLARDYGFLESISMAQQDRATLESMLENHGARAKASTLILSDLNDRIIAQTPSQLIFVPDAQQAVLNRIEKDVHSVHFSTLHTLDDDNHTRPLFHVVKSSIKAPNHIANLIIGDEIHHHFVNNLRKVTNLEMFFITHHNKNWELHASTLPTLITNAFIGQFNKEQSGKVITIDIDNDAYLMLPMPVLQTDEEQTFAVIAKPLSKMMQPYKRVEQMLLWLLVATIVLSIIAVFLVTKKMVSPLGEQAYIDNLTGLGNRRLFNYMMSRAFKRLNDTCNLVALLMLDLDKFKQINDNLGHDVGDHVLKTVADRLRTTLRNTDNIMRLGGDEFAIILEDCTLSAACHIAEKISKSISEPINIGRTNLSIHTSIGIALARDTIDNIDTLMKKADEAMYVSKSKQVDYWCYQEKNASDNP